MIEELLNEPYWVIDFLPEQVPQGCAGQFSAVQKYYLQPSVLAGLHRRFANILLKLNCYDDFHVSASDEDQVTVNPTPESLLSRIVDHPEELCIVLPDEQTLITLSHDDLYMTVYHPSERLLDRIGCLASAEGLFFWQPKT